MAWNQTIHPTSWKATLKRIGFNLFPAYRRSGGRIVYLSENWKEIHVALKKSWKTRNLVGSVFGGSIYAALDPIYMTQFIVLLGKEYVVWDKSAEIIFKRPIHQQVRARFLVDDALLNEVKNQVAENGKYNCTLTVQFEDENQTVYAVCHKVIYIASKHYYNQRKNERLSE